MCGYSADAFSHFRFVYRFRLKGNDSVLYILVVYIRNLCGILCPDMTYHRL